MQGIQIWFGIDSNTLREKFEKHILNIAPIDYISRSNNAIAYMYGICPTNVEFDGVK
jgi:hypothetical protein